MTLRYPRPPALRDLGSRHNVVESSAGTGKTFLLEHLFVELILHHDVPVEQILVVTFTEKAAAELLLRVRGLIDALAGLHPGHSRAEDAAHMPEVDTWQIDEQAKRRLEAAQLAFGRVSISTIHAFCQRVLREHAFGQGRLFDEELADGEAVFHEAFHDVLRTTATTDAQLRQLLAAWLDAGNSVGKLGKLLWECEGKGVEVVRPTFDAASLASAMAGWRAITTSDIKLRQRLKDAGLRANTSDAILRRLEKVSEIVERSGADGMECLTRLHREAPKNLGEILAHLAKGRLDQDLTALAERVRELQAAATPLDAVVAQLLWPVVRARAMRRKRASGRYDYDDMLELVASALDDPGPAGQALLSALRGRYTHGLIDEFQDTDRTQWAIFRRIFVEAPGTRHGLTVVGDPKQAIYGFRSADVRTYLEAAQTLQRAGAPTLQLAQNFRATDALINATNTLFARPGFFRTGSGITYDHPVTCGRPERSLASTSGSAEAPIVLLSLQAEQAKLSAQQVREAAAAAIVDELRRLVDPASPLRLRDGNTSKPLSLRSIFVLTFTNKECQEVGWALGRAGIRHAFYKLGDLWQSKEARDTLDVLRALCAPEDRSLRVKALLTSYFDLELGDIAGPSESAAARLAMERLLWLAAEATTADVPELFSSLVERTGVIRRELWKGGSERGLTNVMHVLEVLQAEGSATHASLPELTERLEAYVRGTDRPAGQDSDLQRLETDEDAVQIMTVHRAKGLEADIVFLFGGLGANTQQSVHLFHEPAEPARPERRALCLGKPTGEAGQRVAEETEDEQSRLHYVALTRARYRLYLPVIPPEFPHLTGSYARLNRHLASIAGTADADTRRLIGSRSFPCPASVEPSVPGPADERPAARAPLSLLVAPEVPPEIARIRREQAGFAVTSYSTVKRLRAGLDASDEGTALINEHDVLREPAPGRLPGGAQTGIFVHEILATVALPVLAAAPAFADWYARADVAASLARVRRRYARPAAHAEPAAHLVYAAYATDIRLGSVVMHGLASATASLRELEFLYPIPERHHPLLSRPAADNPAAAFTIERGVVKGFIDFLFEHEGRFYVCDWKTDDLASYETVDLARHCERHYEVQARIYTLAALRMFGIEGADDYARRFGGALFCFLRGRPAGDEDRGIVFLRPSWDEVLSWEDRMLEPAFWGMSR